VFDSRALRYFVAVAEELNFTRAAERLSISAPPLSRAVRALEKDLGVRLLERDTHTVTLTPAGAVLLDDGRAALDALQAAGRRAQRAGAAKPQVILAVKADNDRGILDRILAAYAAENAGPPVTVWLCAWGEQPRLLLEGHADAALVHEPFEGAGLDTQPVAVEATVAAVPATHPLAGNGPTTLAALGIPITGPEDTRGVRRFTDEIVAEHDLHDLSQFLAVIELGRVPVALLPRSHADGYPRPGLAYLDISDAPPTTLAIAWAPQSRSRAVAALVRAATEPEPSTGSG
jgi:DNA-binding transcriptional LysR family regulator